MKKQILKHNVLLLVQYAVGALSPIIFMPMILHRVGEKEFGVFSVLLSWSILASLIVLYAFQLTGPVALSEAKTADEERSVLKQILFAKCILFFCLLILLAIFFSFWGVDRVSSAFILLLIIPLSSIFNNPWFFQYKSDFRTNLYINLASALSSASLIIFYLSKSVDNSQNFLLPLIFSINYIVLGLGSFYCLLKRLEIKSILFFLVDIKANMAHAFNMLPSNFALFFSQVIAVSCANSGPIFVDYFSGPEEAGKYSILEKIVAPIISAGLLTFTASYPKLVEVFQDKRTYRNIILLCVFSYLSIMVSITTFYFFFENEINFFIFRNYQNKFLFRVFLVTLFVSFPGAILTSHYVLSNRPYKMIGFNLLRFFLILFTSLLLVTKLGSAAWVIGLAVSNIPVLIFFADMLAQLRRVK